MPLNIFKYLKAFLLSTKMQDDSTAYPHLKLKYFDPHLNRCWCSK